MLTERSEEAAVPAKTEKQRRFMAAEYERAKEGKPTKTDMTQKQRHDFMAKKKKGAR